MTTRFLSLASLRPQRIATRKRTGVAIAIATLTILLGPLPPACCADKISVTVDHTGTDPVGQKLAFAIREGIRRSAGYQLAAQNAVLSVNLVTLDPNESEPSQRGNQAIASVVFTMANGIPYQKGNPQTWYPIFLTMYVVNVGTLAVDDIASKIVAALDAAVEKFKTDANK